MLACPAPVTRRLVLLAGFLEMMSDKLQGRIVVDGLNEARRNAQMAPLALALQQRLVGGITHQRVLELVTGMAATAPVDQSGLNENSELLLQSPIVLTGNAAEQIESKRSPYDRAELRDLLDGTEAIETLHQQILQGRGYIGRRHIGARAIQRLALRNKTGIGQRRADLLDEKRNAVAARDDFFDHPFGQATSLGNLGDHRRAVAPAEIVERERGDVRVVRPQRPVLGAMRDDDQDSTVTEGLDQSREKILRRRIDPVHVLDHEKDRRLYSHRPYCTDEHVEGVDA